jgi:polyvinyl alcohol dehydrogenase (cytochrome)
MVAAVAVALAVPRLVSAGQAPAAAGGALFQNNCATCHAGNDPRTPSMAALRLRTPEQIVDALTTGPMREQGADLTDAQRRAIAEYLTGGALATKASAPTVGRCAAAPALDLASGPQWNGWGPGVTNTRFQPAAQAGLTAEQTPKLTLKWAFGFPNATSARALPTVAGGRLFVGSNSGDVYSLDAKTGCTIWIYHAKSAVRSAIVIGPRTPGDRGPRSDQSSGATAYFGDGRANVYALDALSGDLLWSRNVDEHPSAHITGTPTLYNNRIYVPVASGEEGQGGNPRYECCTFRGSLVALDTTTGTLAWKTYTISADAKPIGKNASGTTRWGPSGAGIWSSPTVDVKRGVIYAATGNMYTEPQQATSDSIVAFDLATGATRWVQQVTPKDVFVVGCNNPNGANCPSATEVGLGPDFDFGSAPILTTLPSGKDVIVDGQKSGIGWAFDPDNRGAVLWQYRAGKGSALGGLEFGSAADSTQAYFAVSDTIGPPTIQFDQTLQAGGLHAVTLATGERAWFAAPPPPKCGAVGRGCNAAILAAITVIPGVVFTGSNDGGVRGFSTKDGALLWEFDTNREFETVNGVPAKGASISGPGPIVAGGMVYINSGYGALGGRPGNVLLAFGVQ